ncbi:DUF7344 domain-containing protein [Halobacterium jilantaiense]|uniref:DUF7344 domain-containing protein n=1 Tax=Halobacterium jilantaiense TaxID=355548 RepID=A0A1I0MJ43_9EURY|nr:hypothetical protein [Halobacterium jilantaiense]SEV87820.1 hypothetical protein SAMN04487945_0075 [Halobacterium jilantaiense]
MSVSQTKPDESGREPDNQDESGVGTLQHRSATTDDNADDVDRVFDVLANRRRRQILYLLDDAENNAAEVPELASTIAAWEEGIADPVSVTYDDRKSVQAAVYQHHAPKMAAADLVEFDKRACRLELDPDVDVDALLDRTPEPADDGDNRALSAVSVSAVALATTVSHLASPAVVSGPVAVVVLVVCACALAGLAHDAYTNDD